jgi:predicted alpha/beta hydrolase
MQIYDTKITARDGYQLAATVFGDLRSCRRVVVISSATAAVRRFYRYYAQALVAAGYAAVTYDYRGIGDSRPSSIRNMPARMRDWGLQDMQGIVDWALRSGAHDQVFLVGHSVGGQVAGLLENSDSVRAMLTLSAQSGHWRYQGGAQKLSVAFHVHVTFPVLVNLVGYMPWSWFGTAEDLPPGVALEWARWCRDREYLLGDSSLPLHRYQRFTAPVLAYSIDDDQWGTAKSVEVMTAPYANAERRHLVASDYDLDSLGHFGYFRRRSSKVWQEGIEWLQSQD